MRRLIALTALVAIAGSAPAKPPIPFPGSRTQVGFRYLGSAVTVYSDSFTYPDGALEAQDTNWSIVSGTAGAAAIASNQVNFAGSGKTNPTIYQAPDAGSADMFAEAVLPAVPAANLASWMAAVRVNSNGDAIGVRVRGATGAYQIVQSLSGTVTVISGTLTIVPAAGDVVRLVVAGTTVGLFINGTQDGSAATTTVTTGSRPGFEVRAENVTGMLDNWRSGAGDGS